jgi:hypothetical protein
MDVHVYVNGVLRTDLKVRTIRASYVRPYEAELHSPARHDAAHPLSLNDLVRIREPGTGTTLFRGNVVEFAPGGVAREGATWICYGKRWRLQNETVRINGRGFYTWNRRGHTCTEGQGGEDSPDQDGGKWTAGQIIVDILEHALGVPAGGSAIPGHHSVSGCCTGTYLSADDVAGYSSADVLALDSVVGEFGVNDTPPADAISLLLALDGSFYGWHIDPATGRLEVVDLDALPETDVEAGELGHWQDEAGTDYRLLGNELAWSLDGVFSTLVIQGTDRTTEEQPADIEGTANPGSGDLGELEFVAAPWRGYAAAYRPVYQPKRGLTGKQIDDADVYTPPAGYGNYSHYPRVYQGKPGGAKTVYEPSSGQLPDLLVPSGIIGLHEDPRPLGFNEKLWAWYWARVPFTVQAGPDGDAYHWYGYERTRVIYDPAFRHTTSWPRPGTADDAAAMTTLAGRLLRLYRDVRRQGTLLCDEVDFGAFHLSQRYNVRNLGPWAVLGPSTTPGPTTTSLMGGYRDPTRWDTLRVNAVEVVYDFERDATAITVANTFWMLEEYSELKRRLELNLFAQKELALSEDQYTCQAYNPVVHDGGTENEDPDGADVVLGAAAEGGDAALADRWDRGDGSLWLWMVSLVVYTFDGDRILYAMMRRASFDDEGALVSVGEEQRIVVDAPAPCV